MTTPAEITAAAECQAPVASRPHATPRMIYDELSTVVVGQDRAKRALAVAGYQHLQRMWGKSNASQKSNVLLYGPTGCGKTLLVKTLADMLSIPSVTVDATTLTAAGYKGADVSQIFLDLYQEAGGSLPLARKGIVYIDEVDKILDSGNSLDVGGSGVQRGLLKFLEGSEIDVCMTEKLDTTGILFIASGAFVGLGGDRQATKRSKIGFLARCDDEVSAGCGSAATSTDDFVNYGLIPEFIGRFPIRASVDNLNLETLERILAMNGGVLQHYVRLFAEEGIRLFFPRETIRHIAERAMEQNTGARGLRTTVEELIEPYLFDLPGSGTNSVLTVLI